MANGKPGRKSNKQIAKELGITVEELQARNKRKAKREEKKAEASEAPAAEVSNVVAIKGKPGRKGKAAAAATAREERLKALMEMPIKDLVDQYCISAAACAAPKAVAKADMDLLRDAIEKKLDSPVSTPFGSATLSKKTKTFIPRADYLEFLKGGEGEIELSATERNALEKAKGSEYFADKRVETNWVIVLEASETVKAEMAEAMAQPFAKAVQTVQKQRA